MRSSVQTLEALKREITVVVPAEEVNTAYTKRLHEVAKTIKLNGFRPGKIPVNVVEQRFSQGVLDEVASKLIQAHFDKAMAESQLRVAGMPSVTEMTIKKGEPFEFKATFEVYPTIDLKLLSGIAVDREAASVTEDDLKAMLEKIQKQHATYKVVERDAKLGDRVLIDFDGSIDGEAFEGGAAKQYSLDLGSKMMIPGFEDGIVGMHIGETKDIMVIFPEDYQAEDLKGKAAKFTVVLHKIEEAELAPVDDELAKKMQVEGGVDALKAKVREGMERELKEKLAARLKETVLNKLLELNVIDVPESLVLAEAKHLKKMSMERMAGQYGMKIEQVQKLNFPEELYKPQADKRVRLGLLLAEVIVKYAIQADADKVKARIKEIAAYYQKPEEVEQWYLSNKEALSEIEAAVIEDQAIERLLQDAAVIDKAVDYKDIIV